MWRKNYTKARVNDRSWLLCPGFCQWILGLAIQVWSTGWVEVATGHDGRIGFAEGGVPVLIIFRDGLPRFGFPVAKLVASASTGIRFDQIGFVGHVDGDPSNCCWGNLEPVMAEAATSDDGLAAMLNAAREESLRLAADAEFFDDDCCG